MFDLIARLVLAAAIGFGGIWALPRATDAYTACTKGPPGPSKMLPFQHCMYDWAFTFFGTLIAAMLLAACVLFVLRALFGVRRGRF